MGRRAPRNACGGAQAEAIAGQRPLERQRLRHDVERSSPPLGAHVVQNVKEAREPTARSSVVTSI